jgi:DNA helicase-2/ATP-dependent DNA helicase PcrA
MIELIGAAITQAEIEWAAALMGLGADGFAPVGGDDSRLRAMMNLETCDYEACPGSGKTTLLVAKLAILAGRWSPRQQGICVLSHTNAARNEIGDRLSASAAAGVLMRYPHFVGTIHSFVNEFLATPWLRSLGYPVQVVDTHIALSKRMGALAWKWRNAMEKRNLGPIALSYNAADFTSDKRGGLGVHTDTYQAMVAVCREISEQGYFCFDEMFVWANQLLDRNPGVAADLRRRFPLVFIDEAQDNSEAQSAILHRIFCAGDGPARRQRFGDSNQAIYASSSQDGASTDPFPAAPTHSIPRSYRFPQAIADVVKGFGVTPQNLVGAGPTGVRIASAPKPSAIFLFDNPSVQEVLPRYGAYLIEQFQEPELAIGAFVAVAGVHEMDKDDNLPRAMGHYAPHYDAACARKESAPATLAQFLARARFEMEGVGNTHVLVNGLAAGLLRMGELMGQARTSRGRKSAHRRMVEALEGTPALASYLKLVDLTLSVRGEFTAKAWEDGALPHLSDIIDHFAAGEEVDKLALEFLIWPDEVELVAGDVAYAPRTDNVFSYPHAEPKVHIRLGSIHSVKGETHTATLVLDTFFHAHHLNELKPWLLGARSGGFKDKKGAPQLESTRLLGRLKLHYVAMTRPSHLLCVAMRKDAFTDDELGILKGRGWSVIDCCAPAPPADAAG